MSFYRLWLIWALPPLFARGIVSHLQQLQRIWHDRIVHNACRNRPGGYYTSKTRYGSRRAGGGPNPCRSPEFPPPRVPFGERVPVGFALLPGNYPSKLRAQLARGHHDVGGLQVRELRGYRRHLLRTSESRIGLLPLLLL